MPPTPPARLRYLLPLCLIGGWLYYHLVQDVVAAWAWAWHHL